MDCNSGSSQKKCLNNASNTFCDKNHYLKNVDNEFFIVNTSDFFEIYSHHKALVQQRCDIVCPRDIQCSMHFKLEKMEQFVEHVRDKNLNFHKVIKKLAFFYNKDVAQGKEVFWWSDIVKWEWADVPPNATIRWRALFL